MAQNIGVNKGQKQGEESSRITIVVLLVTITVVATILYFSLNKEISILSETYSTPSGCAELITLSEVVERSGEYNDDSGCNENDETPLSQDTDLEMIVMPTDKMVEQGEMIVNGATKMLLPLIHTDVNGSIEGFMARVSVTQTFVNPSDSTIEALYTFPLPDNCAVDSMIMTIGSKRIKGNIKERGEARAIYENARRRGITASLLEQQRPNIFTQSVANILKNDTIKVTISYVQEVENNNGEFLFNFPMVVGPRYIPGNATSRSSVGTANPTDQVPDADKITPPMLSGDERSGHDISLSLSINGGTVIKELSSESHEICITSNNKPGRPAVDSTVSVAILPSDNIPNKDFILKYRLVDDVISNTMLTFKDDSAGYFQLTMFPQLAPEEDEISPRELVFVIDNSGSMGGFPMDKCRELMQKALRNVRPEDSYNILTFAGGSTLLFPRSVPATEANVQTGMNFSQTMRGSGGTEMMSAFKEIMQLPPVPNKKRIILFMTDAYIGNEQAIIATARDNLDKSRVFTLGVSNAPNSYFLRSLAHVGGGEYRHIRTDGNSEATVDEFYRLIDAPVLTNIRVIFEGIETEEIMPRIIPDLFAGAPLSLSGKYLNGGTGTITITGDLPGGRVYRSVLRGEFPKVASGNSVIKTLWARKKINQLELFGTEMINYSSYVPDSIKEQITAVALEYKIMSQYTSFVAVDDAVRNCDGTWETVEQAVELPEAMDPAMSNGRGSSSTQQSSSSKQSLGFGSGVGSGFGGSSGGVSDLLGALMGGGGSSLAPREVAVRQPTGAGGAGLTGGRSRANIMRVVRQNSASLQYAYTRRLANMPELKGKITIKWAIDEFGKVLFCTVVSSTINDPELEQEIVEKIKRWAFGRINKPGDVTEVVYPFVFQQQ